MIDHFGKKMSLKYQAEGICNLTIDKDKSFGPVFLPEKINTDT